ncbi:MAG TPA: H-X9-DG-CTERM domain-containing protein, partial [Fimbriiglobus sp.]|nr:H-X9-DG-CTERM domain-containing protein [Fimbriiglobus sp.]
MWFGWWYAGHGQEGTGSCDATLGAREMNYAGDGNCPGGPYHFKDGRVGQRCDLFHFWSPHPGGAHFLFADGSVQFLRYDADSILPALATRAGGEAASVD